MSVPALAELTTLRLGGRPRHYLQAAGEAELVAAVHAADAAGEPLLVLAGGSNVVVADGGFDGTVVHVVTRGIERVDAPPARAPLDDEPPVGLEVAAGEPWDPFVARCVGDGLAGIECLSGIPGSVGATPIQNVGAYGQEVAETIVAVRAYDRRAREVVTLAPEACGFAYRSSAFKRDPEHHVVLAVRFALTPASHSRPIRYAELARALAVPVGAAAPLAQVRAAVLALRRGKGMVIDRDDPDSVSVGSFFTNPILDADAFAALEARVRDRLGPDARLPRFPEPDGRIKTSAAWLIERAGFARGHGGGGRDRAAVAISTKHTLALTNRGGGSTAELVALAEEIARGVHERFGVALAPEPVFVGHEWGSVGEVPSR